jgi:hypothetical protein
MGVRSHLPRCSIEIVNVEGRIVPLLDAGAYIEPAGRHRSVYRETWMEEEDLVFVRRPPVAADGGPTSSAEQVGGVHGNFGYELLVRAKTQAATLRVDFFRVCPSLAADGLSLDYEPQSVTVRGSLERGRGLRVEVELQAGLCEEQGRPFFKTLRVVCR